MKKNLIKVSFRSFKHAGYSLIAGVAVFILVSFSPNAAGQTAFDVRSFGATGDGKTLDSPAIDRAIEAASKAGGGRVLFPAGTYLSGSIHLLSNITLDLEAGCIILGAPAGTHAFDSPEPNAFDMYQDFGHSHWHNSLIWGENLENIAVVGEGKINGGGLSRGDKDVSVPDGDGNKVFSLKLCRNIIFRDFTVQHAGHFAFLLTGCDNVTMDNIKIDTNRDGIDLDCCRNVRVSNCAVNSPRDDAICPKSSFGLGFKRATEDVTISNCLVSGFEEGSMLDGTFKGGGGTGRIKFGTESNGGFKNIVVSNCVFDHCNGLAIESVDGGDIDGISVSNITMRECANSPIFIRLGNRSRGPNSPPPGIVRNINISDVTVVGASTKLASIIAGIPGHNIENVRISNIHIVTNGGGTKEMASIVPSEQEKEYPEPGRFGTIPAYGFFCRHVNGIQFNDVDLAFASEEQRPAFVLDEVAGAEFYFLKTQKSEAGSPRFLVRYVSKFNLDYSQGMNSVRGDFLKETAF
jgi:polygalacturonase